MELHVVSLMLKVNDPLANSFTGLPGLADIRVHEAQPFRDRRQSKHQLFLYGYAKFSTLLGIDKWWSMDLPSQVEKKINFFLTFVARV